MKNLRLEIFNAKKNMTIEQEDIVQILESYVHVCDKFSEKEIIKSLNERLTPYKYDKDVKSLLESLNKDLLSHELLYTLKDLYHLVEKRNQGGQIFRQPLNVLLQIINTDDSSDRMGKILNELAIYDWVPEIKTFMVNLTSNPEQKQNLLSSGKADKVYTIVESVKDGYLAYVKDSWFLLKDDTIEKTLLENHITDEAKIRTLRMLETALKFSEINDNRIEFRISENLKLGISTKKKGIVYINDEETSKESTLESIFSSPIIPIVNKNFYPVIMESSNNLDKFVELDVVKKVTNLSNPFVDVYAFNYKNNVFVYRADSRIGNSMFKYESAAELVGEVMNELNYDLTFFYENLISKEVKTKKILEDKVRQISKSIDEIDSNIDKVEANLQLLGESVVLSKALTGLKKSKEDKLSEIDAIKKLMYKEVIRK